MIRVPEDPIRQNSAPHSTRVLVADDNEPLVTIMTWAMEDAGYNVMSCHNGREAVEIAKSFHPDVVLLDIGMPVMNGLEACKAIRLQPDMTDTLMIAQTAWGSEDMRAKTHEAGFDIHLVKPASLTEVVRLVATAHS